MPKRRRAAAGYLFATLRAWTRAHPRLFRAAVCLPGLYWLLGATVQCRDLRELGTTFLVALPGAALLSLVLGAAVRGLVSIPGVSAFARGMSFSARAVGGARPAVFGGLALVLCAVAWTARQELPALAEVVIGALAAVAMVSTTLLERRSRVKVGLDGLGVRGALGSSFVAYRDLDDVRARGGDLELSRAGRVVLRLRMRGDDVQRVGTVLGRIRESIAQAKMQDTGAEPLVEIRGDRAGNAAYREASLSREQLWELVEGRATTAAARTAAAQALATCLADGDRARLRVTAEGCAEPRVRVVLAELAGDDDVEDAPLAARAPRR